MQSACLCQEETQQRLLFLFKKKEMEIEISIGIRGVESLPVRKQFINWWGRPFLQGVRPLSRMHTLLLLFTSLFPPALTTIQPALNTFKHTGNSTCYIYCLSSLVKNKVLK